MSPLAEFSLALLDPARPVPAGLVDPDGEPSAKRFAVYRNNVVVGLVETLAAGFPVVRRLVGEEFFAAMARAYVARELPRSPILLSYGAGFPDFIGAFEPAAELPYLRDVARLERAWVEAYHELHPSLRLVRSSWPIVTIWKLNVAKEAPAHIDIDSGGESALIVRPEAEVEVRELSSSAADLLEADALV